MQFSVQTRQLSRRRRREADLDVEEAGEEEEEEDEGVGAEEGFLDEIKEAKRREDQLRAPTECRKLIGLLGRTRYCSLSRSQVLYLAEKNKLPIYV